MENRYEIKTHIVILTSVLRMKERKKKKKKIRSG